MIIVFPLIFYYILVIHCVIFAFRLSFAYECEYYLGSTQSQSLHHRGIFAGKSFQSNTLLDSYPAIHIHRKYVMRWNLDNYVFRYNDDSGFFYKNYIVFGNSMLMNFNSNEHVNTRIQSPNNTFCETFTSNCTQKLFVRENIGIGEEIFLYKGDSWYYDHNSEHLINNFESTSLSTNTLSDAVCLSHVYIQPSKLSLGGNGLFAKKSFKKGELITISPVVLLPKGEVAIASIENSNLINYCLTSKGDVAILPIGLAALANHQRQDLANMKLQWYQKNSKQIDQINPIEIMSKKSENDIQLDIAYYATRDIEATEELTFDYGPKWIDLWSTYLAQSLSINSNNTQGKTVKFQASIETPKDLYIPNAWNDIECIGLSCPQVCPDDESFTSYSSYQNKAKEPDFPYVFAVCIISLVSLSVGGAYYIVVVVMKI